MPLIITQGQNNVALFNPTQRPTWNGNVGRAMTTRAEDEFNPTQRPTWNGNYANLGGSTDDKLRRWFDTSTFSITPAFTWGNTPRVMPDLRADGTKNFNLSLFKNNSFKGGKFNTQFRAEFFNAFNRVQFSPPGTRVDSINFGVVGGQANSPRQVQLSLKLAF